MVRSVESTTSSDLLMHAIRRARYAIHAVISSSEAVRRLFLSADLVFN